MQPNELVSLLKKHNLKNTKVRREILAVFSHAERPIDAIYLTENIKVNKSSIYRELKVLLDKGIILEIEFGDGKKRYEFSSLKHHHHLICTNCKSVEDVTLNQDLWLEEKSIEEKTSFKIERHNLEFFGLCANCK